MTDKPVRVCACGRIIGPDRAPNATKCLGCAAGKVAPQDRQRGGFHWLHGQHRTVNV